MVETSRATVWSNDDLACVGLSPDIGVLGRIAVRYPNAIDIAVFHSIRGMPSCSAAEPVLFKFVYLYFSIFTG